MVLFRSSDQGRRSGAARGAAAPDALVVPVASIDGWTLEGTPLDGVVPVSVRSELTALLHTIGIGAQTPYVTQRAADLLMRCGQDGQALAVCEAWYALPEPARAGANDRAVAKRLAKLRERLGMKPPPQPGRPTTAELPPAPPPQPAVPPAPAAPTPPAAPPTSADAGPDRGVGSTVAETLSGTWGTVRAHIPPAASVTRRAGRARERVADVARRVLAPQPDTAVQKPQAPAAAATEGAVDGEESAATRAEAAELTTALDGDGTTGVAAPRDDAGVLTGAGDGARDEERAAVVVGEAAADDAGPGNAEVSADEDEGDGVGDGAVVAAGDGVVERGEERAVPERDASRSAGARPEDGRPEKAPPGRRTTGRSGKSGGHPRGVPAAAGPGKNTRRDAADEGRRATGERAHTDDDTDPARTAVTD